ncbi:MAG: NUDIX domain-containing protein [Dehalococcoidia bacterium]
MDVDAPGATRETAIDRPTARVLLLTRAGETLLFRAKSVDEESGRPFWFPPGGGLEAGESHEQAAIRELEEETGLTGVALGPCIWLREHSGRFERTWYAVRERYFLGLVPHKLEIERTSWTELELQELAECRWWTLDEIAASADIFVPRRLAALLPPILRGEYPGTPLRTE